MAIDKLLPRYLNKDDDSRIVKSIEFVDALNVRVSQDDSGNAGVIKNVEGNTIVAYNSASDALPAGNNRVIGHVTNLQKDEAFYFVYNSSGNHSIYRYSISKETVYKIYQDSILNFKETAFVSADVIVNQKEDSILYFTDGINAPKKLNATKAQRGGYPAEYSEGTDPGGSLTDDERLLFITTAKQPPLAPPTWEFYTDASITFNNLYEQMFQFAYQYVYDDGEVSAISPYSTVTYSDNQLMDGLVSADLKKQNNALHVYVQTNIGDVSKIRVLARTSMEGAFFIVDEIKNDRTAVYTKTVNFTNDASYTVISNDEKNKLFDNVPLKAEAQAISGNRLMYGNYLEGYDNVEVDASVDPNYKKRGESIDTDVTVSIENDNIFKAFSIDLSNLPGTIPAGSTYTVDFSIDPDVVKLKLPGYPMSWREWNRPDPGENRISGIVDNFVIVDMTPMMVTESFTITSTKTRSQLAADILQRITKSYPVSFDTVDGLTDHATFIDDVEEDNQVYNSHRYGFFKGTGNLEITQAAFYSATNKITGKIRLKTAQLTIGSLYGASGLNGGTPDYSDKRSIRDVSYAGYGLTVNYTGDESNYTAYTNVTATAGFEGGYPREMHSYFFDEVLNDNSRFLRGTNGTPSFKAGASHSFGVVYYDDRNRSGGVNKINETYVKWFSERGNKGETSMVMRIKGSAPSWATRWSPVYSGNTSISNFVQYSAIEAFTATNPTVKNIASNYNDKIFVSMRSLSGKDDSYREAKGALIDYAYNEGDKVRIYSFGGTYYPNGVEFNVVGYEYFDNSPTLNPILDGGTDNSIYRTTGFFLILEDNAHPKFGKAAVVAGTDDWDNKCVIEIYSKKKTTEGLPYYEIGKSYAVSSGTHDGERVETSGTFELKNQGGWGFFKSTIKPFKGDIFLSAGGVKIKVNNVNKSEDSTYSWEGDCQFLANASNVTVSMTVQNPDTVVEIQDGDIWFRLRQLRHGTTVTTYSYLTDYVEDKSLSDFFSSEMNSFGRANLYAPNAAQIKRTASITYSEPFNFDSNGLLLSSFNLSLANFKDFDTTYGGIKFLSNQGDGIVCLQQNKLSVIPVSRNIIQYASDNADLVASNDILGTAIYRSGDYGCDDNPESVVVRFGRIYYADIQAGKVIAFGASGVEPISEKGMDSYFNTKFMDAKKFGSYVDLNGGYDPDNDEYVVSISDIYNASVVATSGGNDYSSTAQTNSSGTAVIVSPSYGTQYAAWETVDLNWEDVFPMWEDYGNGVYYLDLGSETGAAQLDAGLQSVVGAVDIVVTNTTNDFMAAGQFTPSTNLLTLIETNGVTFSINNNAKVFDGFTVAYDAKSGFWNTFYSYVPERMGYIKNQFFSFKNGRMYNHNTNATRNYFYGTQYDSKITIVSNANASMVKSYESISLEGNSPWSGVFTTTDQSSSVAVGAFDKRERNYYAHINRDTLLSTANYVSIGTVDSVSGTTINMTSRINDIPFGFGSAIYKVDGSTITDTTFTVSSVSGRKAIEANTTVTGITSGDDLLVVSNASIDGDTIRDSFMQIELTNTATTPVELYSINAIYSMSNLHNQQGS